MNLCNFLVCLIILFLGCNYKWYVFFNIIFVFMFFNFFGFIVLIVVFVLIGINIGVLKDLCGVCIIFNLVLDCLYVFICLYVIVGIC